MYSSTVVPARLRKKHLRAGFTPFDGSKRIRRQHLSRIAVCILCCCGLNSSNNYVYLPPYGTLSREGPRLPQCAKTWVSNCPADHTGLSAGSDQHRRTDPHVEPYMNQAIACCGCFHRISSGTFCRNRCDPNGACKSPPTLFSSRTTCEQLFNWPSAPASEPFWTAATCLTPPSSGAPIRAPPGAQRTLPLLELAPYPWRTSLLLLKKVGDIGRIAVHRNSGDGSGLTPPIPTSANPRPSNLHLWHRRHLPRRRCQRPTEFRRRRNGPGTRTAQMSVFPQRQRYSPHRPLNPTQDRACHHRSNPFRLP